MTRFLKNAISVTFILVGIGAARLTVKPVAADSWEWACILGAGAVMSLVFGVAGLRMEAK